MIIVSIYWCLTKHLSKQRLLSYYDINNKLKEMDVSDFKMSNKIKEIVIKNHAYYFFDDMITIKNYPSKMKMDEKS